MLFDIKCYLLLDIKCYLGLETKCYNGLDDHYEHLNLLRFIIYVLKYYSNDEYFLFYNDTKLLLTSIYLSKSITFIFLLVLMIYLTINFVLFD